MYIIYNILVFLSPVVLFPYFLINIIGKGKYRKSIGPKLGFIPKENSAGFVGTPRIWLHAVSVGEVTAAAPIVKALRERLPEACLIVSTGTETGREMARQVMTGVSAFIYFPLDFPCIVRKLLKLTRPDVFAAVETEIWPNFIRLSHRYGTEILLVNARISPRSYKGYFRTRRLWKQVLEMVGAIGAISKIDAERLQRIGVPAAKIRIMGNAKFDGLAARVDEKLKEEISAKLSIPPGSRVFVAGSTHEGEEEMIVRAYSELLKHCPDYLLILVPRHPERGAAVSDLLAKAGFHDRIRMSEIRSGRQRTSERVVIIDVIGELFKAYSLASFVFCGGSLVPKGGQNILEPAAWGKIVFYGPSMEDFQNEKALLESVGCGIPVASGEELQAKMLELLRDPERMASRGEAGRLMIAAHKGASERYAEMIINALSGRCEEPE